MAASTGRAFDIIRHIGANVVNIFNKKAVPCTAPCDGLILKMHYQWTFWVLLGSFSTIWYSWYHRDVITCASHFNAETQVRLDYINICLSYPYVEGTDDGNRRYLLFYRWVHWSLLLLSAIYYIPRKLSKTSENSKVKKLMEDLAVNAHRYDGVERELVERTAQYMAFNLNTHNGLFNKYLLCNVVALIVDLFAFQFFNFLFQGYFTQYGFQAYPFNRDPVHFTDYMSQMFPPFANCELHSEVQLVNKRTERLGCHLTVMELYEKIFLLIWCWLIVLTAMTAGYIVFLIAMWIPQVRVIVLKVAKPIHATDNVRHVIYDVVKTCKVGDAYLLYRLKQHFSHAHYYNLLTRLADPEFFRLIFPNIQIDKLKSNKLGSGKDLRRRAMKGSDDSLKASSVYNMTGEGGYLPNSSILVE